VCILFGSYGKKKSLNPYSKFPNINIKAPDTGLKATTKNENHLTRFKKLLTPEQNLLTVV